MKDFFQTKVMPLMIKFINLKSMVALKEGMNAILPITVVGSIFLLIAEFPYGPIRVYLADTGIRVVLMQVFNSTFNILALICAFTIAYNYAKAEDINPLGAGVTSLVSFIIVSNQHIFSGEQKIEGILSMGNTLGSRGMIAAIIISLITGYIYCLCIKKKLVIKMPESVPEGVQNSFSAIIPSAIIFTLFALVYGLTLVFTNGGDLIDLIYKLVQTPLANLTDSLFGVIIVGFMVSFLWWFGIHGNNVISGIMTGIWISNTISNQEIVNKGLALTQANGGRIVAQQFHNNLVTMTGSGITIGILLSMLFACKSKQFKQIGKLSIVPAIFNINEPILFGIPIVYNPFLFLPFVGVPVVVSIVSYFAIKVGLVPMFAGVNPPWTTPPILSGLLAGGVRTALLQVVIILISTAMYYPFIKILDKKAFENEKGEN